MPGIFRFSWSRSGASRGTGRPAAPARAARYSISGRWAFAGPLLALVLGLCAPAPARSQQLLVGDTAAGPGDGLRTCALFITYLGPSQYQIDYCYSPRHGWPGETSGGRKVFAQFRWRESPGGPILEHEDTTGELCGQLPQRGKTCWRRFRFSGPPGSQVWIAFNSCRRGEFLDPSTCSGWTEEYARIPDELPPPRFAAPRVERVEPPRYLPRRFDPVRRMTDREKVIMLGGQKTRVTLHMQGSLDGFPAVPNTTWGYRPAFLVFWRAAKGVPEDPSTYWGKRTMVGEYSPWTEVDEISRSGSALMFDVPSSAFENSFCDQNRRCLPVEIKLMVFKGPSTASGPKAPSQFLKEYPSAPEQIVGIPVIARYVRVDDPAQRASWMKPPTIISHCGPQPLPSIGRLEFRARQDNGIGSVVGDPKFLSMELQYEPTHGVWNTLEGVTQLTVVPDTRPVEFQASVVLETLRKRAERWRWRVKAAGSEQKSPWCLVTLAPPVNTVARVEGSRGTETTKPTATMARAVAPLPQRAEGQSDVRKAAAEQANAAAADAVSKPAAVGQSVPQVQADLPEAAASAGAKSAATATTGSAPSLQAAPVAPAANAARALGGTPKAPVLAMDKAAMRARGVPESGVDRPGADFRTLPGGSFQECQTACAVDATCRAWSWVKPGVQGPQGKCWLKNGVPDAIRSDCCTSGVK
jgi:hypothetical protein